MQLNDLYHRPRLVAALCAVGATGLGLVYLGLAGAPMRHLAMNAGALVVGFLVTSIIALCVRWGRISAGAAILVLGCALLLASLFGATMDGATRWIAVGGLTVQPSFLILPVMAVCFARSRDMLSAAGIVIAALALAVQPDRAMAGALAAGMAVLALLRPGRHATIALVGALAGFAVTLLRADTLPAMRYVEQIFYSSFDVHPLAGMAVVTGAALMILPAAVGPFHDADRNEAYVMFGTVWLAILAAAALGNYPTPLVGYGGSAIIGYLISLIGLPARTHGGSARKSEPPRSTKADQDRNLCIGLS